MIAPDASIDSIQSALNLLRPILDTRSAAYLILRLPQYKRLIAATFVPYLAPKDDRDYFLAHRYDLVRELGAQHFEVELVCKEVGEILDARSWEERDETRMSGDEIGKEQAEESEAKEPEGVVDLGYVKTKCRLCDRRMQNGIEDTALSALRELKNQPGNAVILVRPSSHCSCLLLPPLLQSPPR